MFGETASIILGLFGLMTGLALIKYYTECNVYKVTGLTEQEIKLKFEGEYNG